MDAPDAFFERFFERFLPTPVAATGSLDAFEEDRFEELLGDFFSASRFASAAASARSRRFWSGDTPSASYW